MRRSVELAKCLPWENGPTTRSARGSKWERVSSLQNGDEIGLDGRRRWGEKLPMCSCRVLVGKNTRRFTKRVIPQIDDLKSLRGGVCQSSKVLRVFSCFRAVSGAAHPNFAGLQAIYHVCSVGIGAYLS